MSRRDETPTTGEMLTEILDLTAGLGVMLLPALLLAVPGLILLLPLALLALPLVVLAAPFVLVHYVRRRLASGGPGAGVASGRAGAHGNVRSRVTPTAAR
jgi:hypothetical protein